MSKTKYTTKFRIWIYSGGEKLLGIGRIELLERIMETGSISKAAKTMNMSYRQAWQMVEEMNMRAPLPLVEKQMGGKSGGGAHVTAAGERAIKSFLSLENKVKKLIEQENKNFKI